MIPYFVFSKLTVKMLQRFFSNGVYLQLKQHLCLQPRNLLVRTYLVCNRSLSTVIIDPQHYSVSKMTRTFSPLRFDLQSLGYSVRNLVCWSCNHELKTSMPFCDSCKTLQPVDKELDFFQILGVARSYKTTSLELRKKYRNLQSILHPDKFSSKSKKEQELSEEFSSVLNKAYSTLSDPLERGLYMLSLQNQSIEEGTTQVNQMFLMEIMERNEEIEHESNPKKLQEFYSNNRKRLESLIRKVEAAFDSKDIKLAKALLTEMKYYNSIETKIKETKQKLNIPD